MGLSASQARLLSITSRISQNELRAEQTTRAKQALAQETADLSKKYINSLNAQDLTYAIYDQNGEKTYMELTGAALSQYAPLKNQYALINANGQILVSELDAANYEASANINEFLAKYGIEPIPTGETRTVTNPAYEGAYTAWKEGYDEWLADKPNRNDPIYWSEETTVTDYDLYDKFLWTTAICYGSAMSALAKNLGEPGKTLYDSNGSAVSSYDPNAYTYTVYDSNGNPTSRNSAGTDCYNHVLSHLLPLGSYTASNGGSVSIIQYNGGTSDTYCHWWDDAFNNRGSNAASFANLIANNKNRYVCCGEEGQELSLETWNKARSGDSAAAAEVLLSDYYYDSSGNLKEKSLQQKIIDLDYGMSEGIFSDRQSWDAINHFVDHDLKNAFTETTSVFDEDTYNGDLDDWKSREPEPLDVPATIEEEVYKYNDNDAAQWYVNLWHRMNGESQDKDGYTTRSFSTTNATSGIFTNQKRWDILEDGLMNNAKWLKYALETAGVTIERVEFADPNEMSTGLRKVKWNSIIYTNAVDISSQKNEKLAAQAEAEFDRKQRALSAKDKQYDSILKLLETEHNTLQQEYETAKSVITKNTERTLKIYS